MAFFDSHLHLARLPHALELARELHGRGYRYTAVACEPWEWNAVQELWKEASAEGWLEGCGFAFGIHPMIAAQVAEGAPADPDDLMAELRRMLENDPNAQVGEAGLDRRYPGYEPGGAQEKVFRMQAEFAIELGRDLQIHCVGDYGRIIRVLREAGFGAGDGAGLKCARPDSSVKRPRPIFHRFGGDAGIVKAGLSLGALFSIHADTLHKKATHEALALIPQANLLFETDADETFCKTHGLSDTATPQDVANALEATITHPSSEYSCP